MSATQKLELGRGFQTHPPLIHTKKHGKENQSHLLPICLCQYSMLLLKLLAALHPNTMEMIHPYTNLQTTPRTYSPSVPSSPKPHVVNLLLIKIASKVLKFHRNNCKPKPQETKVKRKWWLNSQYSQPKWIKGWHKKESEQLAITQISFGVSILEPTKQQYIGWWLKLYGFSNV